MLIFISVLILILIIFISVSLWYYKKVWFYRDPKRIPPKGNNIIISPADGKVAYIKKIKTGKIYSKKLEEKIELSEITKVYINKKEGWICGIYMSPRDVHFNYAPFSSRVSDIVYTKTKANLPMLDLWEYINLMFLHRLVNLFSKKFHFQNERNTIFISHPKFDAILVEIADKFVNKIKCLINKEQNIELGQKIGFIERGSQVDLIIFEKNIIWKVKKGDQVYGARTILAKF